MRNSLNYEFARKNISTANPSPDARRRKVGKLASITKSDYFGNKSSQMSYDSANEDPYDVDEID